MELTATLVALGVLAGLVSTVAGFGGGMVLLLALSLVGSPQSALAITAPALLVGNLHRALAMRAEVEPRVAAPFALGALPGSVVGGLSLAVLPAELVRALMVAMTALAVARAAGWLSWRPRAAQVAPAGFVIGALAASSGGAGLLMAPLLMAAGLSGGRYVATSAAGAVAMHVGRVIGYRGAGLFDRDTLLAAATLTLAILVGNALGARARRRITPGLALAIERGALLVAAGLATLGVGR